MGFYTADGALNAKLVDGATYTGLFSHDGMVNVAWSDGRGAYHRCGAWNVTAVPYTGLPSSRYAPDGSMNVDWASTTGRGFYNQNGSVRLPTTFQDSFTNKIRNPRGEGGVVGTVGVTNKCTGYNAAPPALVAMGTAAAFNSAVTNMTASGGDGSTLFGVVDDAAALTTLAATDPFIAAGLANGWLNGRVFKIDNSASASVAALTTGGTTGNTNKHSASMYMRVTLGTGQLVLNAGGSPVNATSATYARLLSENVTPTGSGNNVQGKVLANSVAYFILFDLIEAATLAPVPTVVAGAAATGALPTDVARTANGMSAAYYGSTVENGLPKYQLRIYGTAAGTSTTISYEPLAGTAYAAVGQAWGFDEHLKYTSTPVAAPDSVQIDVQEYTSAGSFLTNAPLTIVPTTTRTRFEYKKILNQATVGRGNAVTVFRTTAAQAYDFTVDIYAPKLVQLAVIEGPELVTNGDFASGTTGFLASGSASIANISGELQVAGLIDYVAAAQQDITATFNTDDVVRLSCDGYSAASLSSIRCYLAQAFGAASAQGYVNISSATKTSASSYLKISATGLHKLRMMNWASTDARFDNVSVKLVTPGYMPAFPILPPVGVPGDSTR